MAGGAIEVPVKFLADASSVAAEADKVSGTGSKIKTWAKGIGGAIAGAFAIDQVREWIGSASELEDTIGATQQIFGDAAGSVIDWSKTTAESMGMSQAATLDAADTFATFGKGAGLVGKDLASFSGGLTGLAGDLASFRGTSTEQAIQAVGAALRGESEPIRAYGVLLDEGSIKARALSMGLVQAQGDTTKIAQAQLTANKAQQAYNKAVKEHGENSDEARNASDQLKISQQKLADATAGTVPDLTAQQKVLATQAEIFAQTGDAQGDFERTSNSAANQQKILAAEMENAKAAIGTALLPVLQRILGPLQSMAGFLEDNATWLVPVVGAILALVAAYKLLVMIQTAVNAVMALFGVTSAIALGPLLLIILGIAALVAAVILLWKNWDTVWNAIVTAFDAVKNALVAAWQWVADMFSSIWEGIKGAFSSALDFVRGIIDSIRGFFEGIISWLATNWPTILAILTGPFGIAVLLIVNNWQRIVDFFTGLPGLISRLVGGIGDIIKAPFQWAADQVSNIVEGIKSTFSGAVDAVKNLWNTFARGWNAIEIEVPSVHIPWPIDKDVGGFTLGVPDLPTFAKGGIVTRPTLAMIGEAGPEAVIPLGGRNSALVVNVNITTTGLGADSPAIQRAVVAALRGYVGRNGPLELGA